VATSPTTQPLATPLPPGSGLGSQTDFVARLKAVLPARWFPDSGTTVLDGILSGFAAQWAWVWFLLVYVAKQRRIGTATDINLDIVSNDYLGTTLPRRSGETDDAFRQRIKLSIFREQGTRKAVSDAVTVLTGYTPRIFEPRNASDTGGWGARGSHTYTGMAYGSAGGWGSYHLPFQAFVQAAAPTVASTAGVQGYAKRGVFAPAIGGYGVGAIEYTSGQVTFTSASDQEVYNAINAVKPIGTIMWVTTKPVQGSTGGGTGTGGSGTGGTGGNTGGTGGRHGWRDGWHRRDRRHGRRDRGHRRNGRGTPRQHVHPRCQSARAQSECNDRIWWHLGRHDRRRHYDQRLGYRRRGRHAGDR
jgi:hypothetical protein